MDKQKVVQVSKAIKKTFKKAKKQQTTTLRTYTMPSPIPIPFGDIEFSSDDSDSDSLTGIARKFLDQVPDLSSPVR
ncbi:hypothetical protein pb186bvf_007316 [Paramecium bursaria]